MKISANPVAPAASPRTSNAAPPSEPSAPAPANKGWQANAVSGPRPAVVDSQKAVADVANKFYDAFVKGDLETMSALYAPDVKFKDAIFQYSDRAGTMHMWTKILGAKPKIEFKLDKVEGNVAKGTWVADYEVFGRKVHNVINAELTVENGKITKHTDAFPFDKWARQALPIGPLSKLPAVEWLVQRVLRSSIGKP